jgi:hypothetical protein
MANNISVATPAVDADRHVCGADTAPRRRGGGWRWQVAIAAAGLAIVASAAGMSERAAAAGQQGLASTPSFAGYIKKVELGKMMGEVTAPASR